MFLFIFFIRALKIGKRASGWFMLMYGRNQPNIVKQLSSNKILKKKRFRRLENISKHSNNMSICEGSPAGNFHGLD